MEHICDFHIHSRYSRACSKEITIKNLVKYAKIKGVDVLGTGDFTHPKWLEELKHSFVKEQDGIYYTEDNFPFIFQTEISLMSYNHKIHLVMLAPSLEIVEQINSELMKKGRLDYDGRPIFGMSPVEFVDSMMNISKDIEIFPAHIWTPWFGMFGSKSGWDSIKECFQESIRYIHAYETGLSSDPPMNWRVSQLDKFTTLSNSDSHSFWPWRLGREATIFNLNKLSFYEIIQKIRNNDSKNIATIEIDPKMGKYHFDGHRNCNICFSPEETKKHNGICPVCGRELTIGVEARVEQLADRPFGYVLPGRRFEKLLPLSELIAHSLGKGVATKAVFQLYFKLIKGFGNEFNILRKADISKIKILGGEKLSQLIDDNRNNKIRIRPGYDGNYGSILN